MMMNLKNMVLGATFASIAALASASSALATPPPPPPTPATEIAFSISGTGTYDPTGALSIAGLEEAPGYGHYYITVTGTFAVTFNPPADGTTMLDGPIALYLSNGIDSPLDVQARLSDLAGGPIAYGDLEAAVGSVLSSNPIIVTLLDYLASNPTSSIVYNDIDYADYTYSYTGNLATGITGSFTIATPYAVDLGTDPGSLTFSASIDLSPVPEPLSAAIFGAGLLGLGITRRRRA